MEQHNSPDCMTRREMLGKAAATAVLATCWPLGLKDAIAQSRSTGKPLLTDATISDIFFKNRKLLKEFQADPKQFMLTHFSLTPGQESAVRATTPEEVAAIRKGVETAFQQNLKLNGGCARLPVTARQSLVAQAQRFQFLKEVSESGGFAGTLYMNVEGFRR